MGFSFLFGSVNVKSAVAGSKGCKQDRQKDRARLRDG